MKTNNKLYSKLEKPMEYPPFIKQFILTQTDYMANRTKKISRFVSYIEMFEGKPLERIFGFVCRKTKRTIENMLVKEVARNYDHKQWLGDIWTSMYGGFKYPDYEIKKDRFGLHKGKWYFNYCWPMVSPNEFLQKYDIKYSGYTEESELDFFDYITNYIENPKCELLMKAGLGYWTKYIKHLDTSKKAIHEVFKINQDQVPLLQSKSFGYKELMVARRYGYTTMQEINTRLVIRHLCRKERYYDNSEDEWYKEILKREETFKYLVNRKMCSKMFSFYDYIDYLKELKELGALSDPKALYPKQFQKAHREAMKKIKKKESEKLLKGFEKSYSKYKKYEFKKGNLLIIAVSVPEQLYKESETLEHCVRDYDEDVAEGKTEIMFIRNAKTPNKPYYTLELKKKKVEQIRGFDNCEPNKKVKDFVKEWSKKFKIKYTGEQEAYA